MSHSAPLSVEKDLEENFKKANENSNVRYFQVHIKEENLVQVFSYSGTDNLEQDFETMKEHATEDQASYFLFRLAPKEWLFLTYVPDKVAVKDKMVTASAKGTLKSKLGFQLFTEEAHATSLSELSYTYYKTGKSLGDSRSTEEILREKVLKQEEEEKKDRKPPVATGGGYHAVTIPLSDEAKEKIEELKQGKINFIELAINESKDKVKVECSKEISSISELQKSINTSEPRFYLYAFEQNRLGISKVNVYIYCCPEKSNPKLRMVYSTSKPTLAAQIEKLELELNKKRIEITDATELTEDYLKEETDPRRMSGNLTGGAAPWSKPSGDGTTKAKNVNSIASHPVYSLMSNQASPGTKKKIVVPPRGAYGGY